MRRDKDFPHSMIRDTLEYAEARKLLAEKARVKQRLTNLNTELRLLQCLSPEAVALAKMDVREQECNGS
jgi:hypothetical protein